MLYLKSIFTKLQLTKALNALRSEIERVDDETKWAALELMLGTSSSVVALAKKMAKPETKTVTRTVAVPKTKIVKQQPQQQTTPKDTERTDFTPIRPQPPLPNQQDDRDKRWKHAKSARFEADWLYGWHSDWHSETLYKYFCHNTARYSKRRKNVLFIPLTNL